MKTHSIPPLAGAWLAALTLGLAAFAPAHAQNNAAPAALQSMNASTDAFALAKISGRTLKAANGDDLSTVTDFLVEPTSGAVRFALAPSGGGPNGETFRMIPLAAIDPNSPADALKLRIDKSQWEKAGTITEPELKGHLSVNAEHQQRLTQQFSLPAAAGDANAGFGDLVRASSLRGQPIRSGNDQLGTVDDVLIDLHGGTSAVVVKTSAGVVPNEQRFIVPFSQLQFGADANAGLTTNLPRASFQAQPALTPTGYPSSAFNNPSVNNAVTAVQQALDRDATVRGNVQVVPESRLVLRGFVPNDQKRAEIERAAQQAAPGARIDNELTVRGW